MLAPHTEDARRAAWKTERRLIQDAVDSYYADEGEWPVDAEDEIDFEELIDEEVLFETPESAEVSYTWFLKSNHRVQSYLTADPNEEGYAGVFP